MTSLTDTIDALTDEQAIRALADLTDYQAPLPDPGRLQAIESDLREAITADSAMVTYIQPGTTSDPAGLARVTLQHLVSTRPELTSVIAEIIERPSPPVRDPVTLGVGALVILALQTELKLTRNSHGAWTFTLHKQPMRESTLAQVMSKLISMYLPGRR